MITPAAPRAATPRALVTLGLHTGVLGRREANDG